MKETELEEAKRLLDDATHPGYLDLLGAARECIQQDTSEAPGFAAKWFANPFPNERSRQTIQSAAQTLMQHSEWAYLFSALSTQLVFVLGYRENLEHFIRASMDVKAGKPVTHRFNFALSEPCAKFFHRACDVSRWLLAMDGDQWESRLRAAGIDRLSLGNCIIKFQHTMRLGAFRGIPMGDSSAFEQISIAYQRLRDVPGTAFNATAHTRLNFSGSLDSNCIVTAEEAFTKLKTIGPSNLQGPVPPSPKALLKRLERAGIKPVQAGRAGRGHAAQYDYSQILGLFRTKTKGTKPRDS